VANCAVSGATVLLPFLDSIAQSLSKTGCALPGPIPSLSVAGQRALHARRRCRLFDDGPVPNGTGPSLGWSVTSLHQYGAHMPNGLTVMSMSHQRSLSPMLVLPDITTPVAEVDMLIDRLADAQIGHTCNHYADGVDGAGERRERLRSYLVARWAAPVVLVGEAAGYQGCRLSGIAFTSVHQLGCGTTKEPSATIVHRVLANLDIEERVLLWNVVPTHPHREGVPTSNRTPTSDEVAQGSMFLPAVTAGRRVVAVGRIAAAMTGADYVRHPAHGGAPAFETGLRMFFDSLDQAR